MPNRLALLGGKSGPLIDFSRVRRPALQISGLCAGALVRVVIDAETTLVFASDGLHVIRRGSWAQLFCDKPTKALVCVIVSQKAA